MNPGSATLSPVAESYSQLDPREFADKVNQSWDAATELKDRVIEQVQQGGLTPMAGAGIISCIAGQVTGYQEFHRELRPADLVSVLRPSR